MLDTCPVDVTATYHPVKVTLEGSTPLPGATDIAWAAGLLEGEGYFVIANSVTPKVAVEMTDEDIVRRLHAMFGGSVHVSNRGENWPSHYKQSWTWTVHGDTASSVMEAVLPYMGIRRAATIVMALGERSAFKQRQLAEHAVRAERVLSAKRLREEGKSLRQIGSVLGVTHETVRKMLTQ